MSIILSENSSIFRQIDHVAAEATSTLSTTRQLQNRGRIANNIINVTNNYIHERNNSDAPPIYDPPPGYHTDAVLKSLLHASPIPIPGKKVVCRYKEIPKYAKATVEKSEAQKQQYNSYFIGNFL